jgi:sulfide:quinone oxidoreductase
LYFPYLLTRIFLPHSEHFDSCRAGKREFEVKPTTVILGAGFGGLAAATTLRQLLPDDYPIVVVDKSPTFLVGASKTWMMLGQKSADELTRSRVSLLPPGVEYLQAEAVKLNLTRGVVTTSVRELHAGALVIALGADVTMDPVPGLAEAAENFYTFDGAQRLNRTLEHFEGGEIVFLIPRTPFKCPPAPYEAAMLLRHAIDQRGLSSKTIISIYTIEPAPMPTAGPEMGTFILSLLRERNIAFYPLKKTMSVDAVHRMIRFDDGSEASYDLLIAIPPHVAPAVVREAGLTDQSGWIPVDSRSLRIQNVQAPIPVFAIGDCTTIPLPGRYKPDAALNLPKAGVFAASQGIVAAHQIACEFGQMIGTTEFDGKGFCYVEVGNGMAIKGEGSFFELPQPKMEMRAPDKEQFDDKLAWVEQWLRGQIR